MQNALVRLDGWLSSHRKLVLGLWVGALLVATPFSLMQSKVLTQGGFQTQGTDSFYANKALDNDFGRRHPRALGIAFVRAGATPAQFSRAVVDYAAKARTVKHIEAPPSAVESARIRALHSNEVMFPLTMVGNPDESADAAFHLRDKLGVANGTRGGVTPYLVGAQALWAALHKLQTTDVQKAERIGVPITLVILLATFGSLAAAVLPLALGLTSVTITGALIYFVAKALPMSIYVTSSASMIGIGVAIDYSLFVLARYRQEIAAGKSEDEARQVALRTSGLAVVFSGITVILSLCALLAFPTIALRSMALGAILVVAMSVLAAVTLMPAVMTILGRRAYQRGRIAGITDRLLAGWRRGPGRDFWARWTRRVMKRPLASALASAAVLLILAAPALSIRLSEEARSQLPAGHDALQGLAVASRLIGPGALGPLQTVVRFDSGTAQTPANRAALSRFAAAAEADPEVAYVAPPRLSLDRREVSLTVVPRHFGEQPAAQALIDRLRHGRATGVLSAVASVHVGGDVAMVRDFRTNVSHNIFRVFVILIAVTLVVMLLMLRSVLLPIKAAVMNLLTVGASTGVSVAIFQWGWLDWTGYQSPGYIDAAVIPLMMAVVFGLSMDYEVFMLTRIREAYLRTRNNTEAVATGLQSSAGTISSAALVMVSVFFAFAAVAIPSIREIGAALGIAIALDATLVRLILVPATMGLLGHLNWWLPSWLQRMPRIALDAMPDTTPRETR